MEEITELEMYIFYQQKKRPNVTQSDIVKCILENKFSIPFNKLDQKELKSCESEVKQLVNRLKKILKSLHQTKKIESLNDKEFINLNNFPALLNLSISHALKNSSSLPERLINPHVH